ncbi:MAG: response regulator transcription factor, partial [Miltoncostaeaceae bacterium]
MQGDHHHERAARRALVIEDEPEVRRLVVTLLARAGLHVEECPDGAAALEALGAAPFDVVILDVGLPRLDGWHVLERIRAADDVPVLMLTGRASEIERVRGLRSGADDYVVKPFGRMELVARVQALLRRRPPGDAERRAPPVFDDGRLRIDPFQRRTWWDGEERRLSATEFRLLLALVEERERTVTQDELA